MKVTAQRLYTDSTMRKIGHSKNPEWVPAAFFDDARKERCASRRHVGVRKSKQA